MFAVEGEGEDKSPGMLSTCFPNLENHKKLPASAGMTATSPALQDDANWAGESVRDSE